VKNVEELTLLLRPIVNDARIFSDKIARHPEILGVRGAIKPEDGTKSLPPVGILRR
jgi:phospholipid/cholesterol/gamma-HCH transport system substrate-binding protein